MTCHFLVWILTMEEMAEKSSQGLLKKKKKNQFITSIYLKTHDAFNYNFNNLSTQYTFISIKNIKLNIKKNYYRSR
jgi:hypothetical protein